MLNKMKKIIIPFMLGAMLFGGVSEVMNVVEPVGVYATETEEPAKPEGNTNGTNAAIPNIQMGTNGLDIGNLKPQEGDDSVYDKALTEFRTIVIFISGIGTVCMILFFILNFINLGKSQGNPQERQKAISGLIITGIATAGLGSVTLIASLFYGMIGK